MIIFSFTEWVDADDNKWEETKPSEYVDVNIEEENFVYKEEQDYEMSNNEDGFSSNSKTDLMDQLVRVPPTLNETPQMYEFPSCKDNISLMKTIKGNIKKELDNLVEVATKVNYDLQEDRLKTYAIQTLFKHCPDDLKIDLLNNTFDPDKSYGVNLGCVLQAFVQDIKPTDVIKSYNKKQ